MQAIETYTVIETDASSRLDVYLTGRITGLTRSGIKNLFDQGMIDVNGHIAKAGYKIKKDDLIEVRLPGPTTAQVEAEDMPVSILYEDDDIIVIDKPAGLAVHPGAGRSSGTLVNALLSHSELAGVGGAVRPGIVHRLDKDTTGVLVAAKNDTSYMDLARQFKEHSTERTYTALVWGAVKNDEGVIDLPIGRDAKQRKKISPRSIKTRAAVTCYRVIKRYSGLTLLECSPRTGRTHQIRVHLSAINHPVVGDQTYGRKKIPTTLAKGAGDALKKIKRQLLHASTLGLRHPVSGAHMVFKSPLPKDMDEVIKTLEKECS